MTFDEILEHVRELLQSKGRVAYPALKLRFGLDDTYLEALKAELIDAEQVAADEDGKVLIWVGDRHQTTNQQSAPSQLPPVPPVASQPTARPVPEAERRQLTVEFIDLVGSTALSERLDPEELRDVVRAYQEVCAQIIRRYEGHLAKYLGDGILVYFGYPVAHEDDATRAVRAGLGIVEAMQELNARLAHPLQVRIGIHTGLVVAGEMGTADQPEHLAIVGETPNIAARVQGEAEPNGVMITSATYRVVQGLFECEDRGSHELKGLQTPLQLYRVVGESAAQSRFEVAIQTGLTPLVGREPELGFLQQHWEQAKAGAGQVVLLSGEPGIGKSRLVQELKDQLAHEGVTRIEFRCSPYHQNSALYPIIDHLQRLLQFEREDSPETKLEKLQHTLSHYRFLRADTVPLLAALLSLPHPVGYPLITVSSQKQKEKTHAALVAWLVEEAEQQPVCTTWEDIHWADPSTLEVLNLVIDQTPTARLYVLVTFRFEFSPPWGNRSHVRQLTLSRLERTQTEVLVERVTGGKTLPAEVVQQIVAKTDGVPLFVEELTKTVVESELLTAVNDHYELNGPLPPLAIPSTLHASLLARLDRLSTVREIAQLGATIGREFSYELLQAVSRLDDETLQHGLKQLVEAELVYQRGLPPQAHYLFKHALIQDTAYQSLLKSTRQQYHRQIAQVLADRFPETVATQPELVAHHYTEAGLIAQALPHWQRAGERASQRSASVEAVVHFTRALEVLKALPDTPERTQQELTLQLALGIELTATKGYAAPTVEHAYNRALELCRQMEETPQLFSVLRGLQLFYMMRAEFPKARTLAEQLLRLAQRQHDPVLLVGANSALGQALYYLGEFSLALAHLEQGLALYDPQQPQYQAWAGGHLGVQCLGYAAWVLWYLGYPDQALKKSQEALTLAKELSHSVSLATALYAAVVLHHYRREWQRVQERTEALLPLATEQGFAFRVSRGTIFRGRMLVEQGQVEEGFAQIRQGIAADQAIGAEVGRPFWLTLLAEAYGKVGQVDEGLHALAEGLTVAHKTGEGLREAEFYRLKGELTLQQAGSRIEAVGGREKTEEAEECFLKAIEVAQKQQAKSLELRAVMSLARLWQQQGKTAEAHQLLSEIYNWFTEGFDTKDLQEAKALREELH